jgi:DNA replication and repair protein RecF
MRAPSPMDTWMYLAHLTLNDFRNYRHLDLALNPGLFLFSGENAQGKTNLLEAVAMLATSNSFHAGSDREVINWDAQDHLARVSAGVRRQEDEVKIEIVVIDPAYYERPQGASPAQQNTHRPIELPASAQRKRIKVNGVPKKAVDLVGQMKVVLFAPTDLHLVDGSPEDRRRFLDRSLCQMQPRYYQAWQKYRKVITQRAALLKRIRENQEDPSMLSYLDGQLVAQANLIMFERRRMIAALNEQACIFQETISGGREHLQIAYRPSFSVDPGRDILQAQQHYHEQLHEVRRKEIHQGVCLLGPHRDDMEFLVDGVSMLTYGSRGQQRTVALSAKLAELAYMRASTGDEPVLLLDDVFSELDHLRREYLLQQVLQHEQVLLTATDFMSFPEEILAKAHRYQVVNGEIV